MTLERQIKINTHFTLTVTVANLLKNMLTVIVKEFMFDLFCHSL